MKYCQIGNNRMLKCSFSEPETSAGGQPGFWGQSFRARKTRSTAAR